MDSFKYHQLSMGGSFVGLARMNGPTRDFVGYFVFDSQFLRLSLQFDPWELTT